MKNFFIILCFICSTAFSKDTIKLVLPQPPGGLNDVFLRFIQKQINENTELNLNAIVVNKPGGDGIIAMREILNDKSEYVMLLSGTAFLFKSMETEENYLAARSLIPVIQTTTTPTVFFVDKTSNIKTWNDLIQYSKSNNVNIGMNSAIANYTLQEVFPNNTFNRIPFSGDTPVLLNIRNKTLDVGTSTYFTVMPLIESGDIVAICITHENDKGIEHRHSNYGNVPIGFYAPPSMTAEKINRMHSIIHNIMKSKEIKEMFANKGVFLSKNLSQENYTKIVERVLKK